MYGWLFLILRSWANSTVGRGVQDALELVGLKGYFPTRPEDSVEMSTSKGTSSGSIEEGGEKI
ncbi:hypothetical protein KY284_010578 [Solanum tuberosum]|nr:hypothetical protein KY284_010578 [Solanum tuberosum]